METYNPLVSIVVPIYNTETYLPACINSLCSQSYTHIQIILVDDQSPDSCPKICDSYERKDERIKVIHQKNKGVSGARNTGISHANGDFIMFVDSDDELFPNAVETLLKDSFEYNADIVSATSTTVDEKGKCFCTCADGAVSILQGDTPLLLSLKGDCAMEAVWAKLFRTDFLKGIRFEESKNINEDIFFMFLCCVKKPIMVQHNVPVYKYNIRQDSCSRQVFSDKYLSMLYFLDRKREYTVAHFPQYVDQVNNMEVRTNLQLLDLMCSCTEKKYKELQRKCVQTVRKLRSYHEPINKHHRQLAWVVSRGLYPIYKMLVRMKYYR